MVNICIIVAMARNRAIGLKGEIPWHIPDDLKRFKMLTLGHPCIMGRKTFESILARLGKPLPGRDTIVVSRAGFSYPGVPVCSDIETAIDVAKKVAINGGKDKIFVCGGAQIYAASIPKADRLYITEVDLEPDADVFMPEWDHARFQEISRESHAGTPAFSYVDYTCQMA